MTNIIRAQIYGIFHKKRAVIAILALFVLCAVTKASDIASASAIGNMWASGSYTFVFNISGMISMVICCGIITGFICADDFTDRTSNYEIMEGHTRSESYFGRAIAAFLLAPLISLLIFLLPVVMSTCTMGWGTVVTGLSPVRDTILIFIVLLRFTAFFVLLSFTLRNPYFVVIASIAGGILTVVLLTAPAYLTGVTAATSVSSILSINSWEVYGVVPDLSTITDQAEVERIINRVSHCIITSDCTQERRIVIVITSFVFSLFYILTGYAYYKKDDLR